MTVMPLLLLALSSQLPSAPPSPMPTVVRTPYGLPAPVLVTWRLGEVRCGTAIQPVTLAVPVRPSLTYGSRDATPAGFTLRIDASGRPLGIAHDVRYIVDGDDLAPALAATRFTPGAERTGCTASYTPTRAPIDAAPVEALTAYTMFPTMAPPAAMRDRLRVAGSTCEDPAPEVRLRGFPDFKAMPDQPGYQSWSMTGFDIDRRGRPTHVRTTGGSGGSTALDRGAREAVMASRFAPGAHTGCRYPYWKGPAVLAAPAMPERDTLHVAGSTCPPGDPEWTREPALDYPAAYNRRSIEGWAIVAYDVAPWGQTGNARVLQAEPSSDFGEAALAIIRGAVRKPEANGYTGCIERVRFAIRKPGMPEPETPRPPMPIG